MKKKNVEGMARCEWRKQNVQNHWGRRTGFMTDKDRHTRSKELMDRCHMDRDVKLDRDAAT